MARNFRHKRPQKPEQDEAIFRLLRLMRNYTTKEIAEKTWVSKSTISKWRTRRTRYPTNITMTAVKKALGVAKEVWKDKDGNDIDV